MDLRPKCLALLFLFLLLTSLTSVSAYMVEDDCNNEKVTTYSEMMVQKLGQKLGIPFEQVDVAIKDLDLGDVIVYGNQNHIQLLRVTGPVSKGERLILEGSNHKKVGIEYNYFYDQHFVRIKPNGIVDSFTIMQTAAQIQKEEIDEQRVAAQKLNWEVDDADSQAQTWGWTIWGGYYYTNKAIKLREKARKLNEATNVNEDNLEYYSSKNSPMLKVSDSYEKTDMNHELTSGLNITSRGKESLQVCVNASPAYGTLKFDGTNFIYTPLEGFIGKDTFQYRVTDTKGGISNIANVNIEVLGDKLTNPTETLIAENKTVNAADSMKIRSFVKIDGYSSAQLKLVIQSFPKHGKLVVGKGSVFSYTAFKGFRGVDMFSFRLQNKTGDLSNIAWVKINVSQYPF